MREDGQVYFGDEISEADKQRFLDAERELANQRLDAERELAKPLSDEDMAQLAEIERRMLGLVNEE